MRKLFTFILLSFIFKINAQQEPQFSMYWNSYQLYNPAAVGLFNKYNISIAGRNQWVGIDGAPVSLNTNYDMKIKQIHGGAGISYLYDKIGNFTNNKINLNYSFHINLNHNRLIGIGISEGIHILKTDFNTFNAIDPNDPLLQSKSTITQTKFNLNAGLMYSSNKLNIGISSTQLSQPYFDQINYKDKRHYYITGSYKIKTTDNLTIIPSFLWETNNISSQIEGNLRCEFKNRYWAGAGYRKDDAIIFMAGVNILGKYRIGYSYDYTTSQLKNTSHGSHEIILLLTFGD